jgi:cytochrome P450
MTLATDLYYEPWDPACRDRAFELYQELLEHAPVYETGSGMYVVSRFDDVRDIMARPHLFSNRPNQDETIGFPPKIAPDTPPEVLQQLLGAASALPLDLSELLTARVIVGADAPQHTRQRAIVSRGFTPRRIAEFKDIIERIVGECLTGIDGWEGFDLVERLAIPLPVRVIADILSVDAAHYPDVKRWSNTLASLPTSEDRGSIDSIVALLGMLKEFSEYFVPRIEARRAHPLDDLLSDFVRAEDVDTMTATEAVLFLLVLMAAGNETSTNLIGNTVVALLQNPDQLALLEADPGLLPKAIEESVRYRSPFQFLFREAIEDVEVAGTVIPKGGMIVILVGAANHDPRHFDQPDRFDITRTTPHLAFGHGIHFCLGAHLGRAEATGALTGLLPHLSRFRLADEPLEPIRSLLICGYQRIPLVAAGPRSDVATGPEGGR